MTKPIPDTDPLTREPPGEVSKVPDNDVGAGGRPAGKPGESDTPSEADPQDNIQPRGDEPMNG